jgi:hypothetical protein
MHGRFNKGDLGRDAGTLGGIGSFEICDSVTMNPGSGVCHMGGGVTDVGTSDGGGRRPGGGSNGARGVDGGENIVGPNGGFLGAHNGKPLGKLTGSLLGSLSGNAILDSGSLGGGGHHQAGVLDSGKAGFYPGNLGTVSADSKLSVNDEGAQAIGVSHPKISNFGM